jgi:hypothetical protein
MSLDTDHPARWCRPGEREHYRIWGGASVAASVLEISPSKAASPAEGPSSPNIRPLHARGGLAYQATSCNPGRSWPAAADWASLLRWSWRHSPARPSSRSCAQTGIQRRQPGQQAGFLFTGGSTSRATCPARLPPPAPSASVRSTPSTRGFRADRRRPGPPPGPAGGCAPGDCPGRLDDQMAGGRDATGLAAAVRLRASGPADREVGRQSKPDRLVVNVHEHGCPDQA